jgi:predicted ATPase
MGSSLIERLVIDGFKSLKEVCIQIKPITVFIGLNSSGKTSVLQALAILKQSTKDNSQNLKMSEDLIQDHSKI